MSSDLPVLSRPVPEASHVERVVETALLASRWLLLPLYLILCLFLVVFALKAGQELIHVLGHVFELTENELVLATLSVIDMTLVASLLVMVALSGYETFVSRFDTLGEMEKPSWLGKLDPGTVKIKLAVSIVSISAIHLLKSYLTMGGMSNADMLTATAVHLAFVSSALLLAWVDRLAFAGKH
jgi:uncharacterized protein (TIGR00645 family)